jgi:hypothetical protein
MSHEIHADYSQTFLFPPCLEDWVGADHNTLGRFWRDHRKALREVFRAGVKVAAAQGLIGMICHAVDGTKIRAVALLRQRAQRQDPVRKALLRRRSVIIEPVFASVKQAMGFRRWTVRGLDNVRTQWALPGDLASD